MAIAELPKCGVQPLSQKLVVRMRVVERLTVDVDRAIEAFAYKYFGGHLRLPGYFGSLVTHEIGIEKRARCVSDPENYALVSGLITILGVAFEES